MRYCLYQNILSPHRYAKQKMQTVAADVTWFVCVSVTTVSTTKSTNGVVVWSVDLAGPKELMH